jgi:transcriptional regulator GlxA family with amidase domain
MDGRIFKLREQLLKNLQHQWTVEEMAEIVELSSPHFQRLFKSHIGSSPIAYLREIRLEKARECLETEFCRLKQIGVKVGMPNASHFTRDFKRKYGLTPTEYRKQYWEKIQAENANGQK